MTELKKELSLTQGIGLLVTSLLGTGVFAVPAIVAYASGRDALWAWPILLVLIVPVAIVFAELGKRYPSAGGVAHFVELAFSPILGRVAGLVFLSVIPFGLPAALYICSGFWHSVVDLSPQGEFLIHAFTLLLIWTLGQFGAGASGWVQTAIAILIIGLILSICFASSFSVITIEWPAIPDIQFNHITYALGVMFWCFVGLEAFVHLTSEFKDAERDFPKALIIGLLIAGFVYWAFTAAVLYFLPENVTESVALPKIVEMLFGRYALWGMCIIGYLACFASMNVYSQSFARLIWDQSRQYKPNGYLAKLSKHQAPVNALTIVVLFSFLSIIVIRFFTISLSSLLEYANGVFVLIYLLCMLAAVQLLTGRARLISIVGAIICSALLVVIGEKSLYALGLFIIIWTTLKLFSNNKSAKA